MFKKRVRVGNVWTTKWVSEPRTHMRGEKPSRKQKGPEFPDLLLSLKSCYTLQTASGRALSPLGIQKRQGRGHKEKEGNAFKAEV